MSLSSQLYRQIEQIPEVDHSDRDTYLWIWHWLLSGQPEEFLETALNEIETAVESQSLRGQTIAEMAWKAQAIELLMDQ